MFMIFFKFLPVVRHHQNYKLQIKVFFSVLGVAHYAQKFERNHGHVFSYNTSIKKRFRPTATFTKNYSHFIKILQAKGHFLFLKINLEQIKQSNIRYVISVLLSQKFNHNTYSSISKYFAV